MRGAGTHPAGVTLLQHGLEVGDPVGLGHRGQHGRGGRVSVGVGAGIARLGGQGGRGLRGAAGGPARRAGDRARRLAGAGSLRKGPARAAGGSNAPREAPARVGTAPYGLVAPARPHPRTARVNVAPPAGAARRTHRGRTGATALLRARAAGHGLGPGGPRGDLALLLEAAQGGRPRLHGGGKLRVMWGPSNWARPKGGPARGPRGGARMRRAAPAAAAAARRARGFGRAPAPRRAPHARRGGPAAGPPRAGRAMGGPGAGRGAGGVGWGWGVGRGRRGHPWPPALRVPPLAAARRRRRPAPRRTCPPPARPRRPG
jgi:hypothetical protein